MEKKTYSEKLKDPRWQKKRLEILERDHWACVSCGEKDETLHIHHMFYFYGKEPWDIHNGFLITLCKSCHNTPRPCDPQYKKCKDCPEYGTDCFGSGDIPGEIISDIGKTLNLILENRPFYGSDVHCALTNAYYILKPG
jgi:hypothetical protein